MPGAGPRPHWTPSRTLIFVVVLLGATLLPLSIEILQGSGGSARGHAQDEVTTVEQAGKRMLHGKELYLNVDAKGPHRPVLPAGEPKYDAYFPYMPGMALFGLPSGTDAPPRLTDARVAFSLITIIVVIVALAMCRGPSEPRVLALQAMTVLPTAALPLATGGDDLPVVAFMLLALVLLERRRPGLAGLAVGAAASLKFTAWPLIPPVVLFALARRERLGRRAPLRALLGMAVVLVPSILPVALRDASGFLDNVVKFPLGLAGSSSPAASALPGHLFVTAFPWLRKEYAVVLVLVGLIVVGKALLRWPLRSADGIARLLAWASAIAILLAPATRVGYALYPLDFAVWAWLLSEEAATALRLEDSQIDEPDLLELRFGDGYGMDRDGWSERGYWGSPTAKSLSSKLVRSVDPAGPRNLVGLTTTAKSQRLPSLAARCPTTSYPGGALDGPWVKRRHPSAGSSVL
jgi:hypothetical protein